MRRRNQLAIVVLVLIPMAVLMATPTVRLAKPPPGHYSIEELWWVTLTNPDHQTYMVWLEGRVLKEGQEVFWAQTDTFPLPPGMKQLHYRDVHVVHSRHALGYGDFAARVGGLPEGEYTFEATLQPDYGSSSININVKPVGPPRLISPRDGDSITARYPQLVWTPPSPRPVGIVTYDLKLAEVLPGQTPEEALLANLPWFTKSGLTATSFTYPASAREFDPGTTFAWQVSALPAQGGRVKSEVSSFRICYGPKSVTVAVTPPPNNQLTMEDLWHARLTNLDGTVSSYLHGYIMKGQDTVLSAHSKDTLTLASGPRVLTAQDITGVRDV